MTIACMLYNKPFFQKHKIDKRIIKGMRDTTKKNYLDKETNIDFSCVIYGLIELSLAGVQFLCSKLKHIIEMAKINNDLLDSI